MKTNLPIFNFYPIAGPMSMNNLQVRNENKIKIFLWGLLYMLFELYILSEQPIWLFFYIYISIYTKSKK